MKRKQTAWLPLVISTDIDELHHLAKLLNENIEAKVSGKEGRMTELRRLVRAWSDSGHNVAKLFEAEPMLARHARNLRAEVLPSKHRYARLAFWTDSSELSPSDPRAVAIEEFVTFLLHPNNDKVRGPCRYCDRFFVNTSNRTGLIYCSEECGHRFTSREANRDRQRELHLRRLRALNKAVADWERSMSAESFRDWIVRRPKYGITQTWLSRAEGVPNISWPKHKNRFHPSRSRRR